MLHSAIDGERASARQYFSGFSINGKIALDAGNLAFAASDAERRDTRDIIITHAHLDHIAGLPIFVDELFTELSEPINIHCTAKVRDILEDNIFNWEVYPRFSELENGRTKVLEYKIISYGKAFSICDVEFLPVHMNHSVDSAGFFIRDGNASIAFTGDTSSTDEFWKEANETQNLKAVFIECAMPDELSELAESSKHLTPSKLATEIEKLHLNCPIYVINIKGRFLEKVTGQLAKVIGKRVTVLNPGVILEF